MVFDRPVPKGAGRFFSWFDKRMCILVKDFKTISKQFSPRKAVDFAIE